VLPIGSDGLKQERFFDLNPTTPWFEPAGTVGMVVVVLAMVVHSASILLNLRKWRGGMATFISTVAVAVFSLIGAICTLVYVYFAMGAIDPVSNFKLGPAFTTLLLSSFTGLTTVAFIKQPSTLGLLDVVAGTSPSASTKGIMRGLLFDILMHNPLGTQVCFPFKHPVVRTYLRTEPLIVERRPAGLSPPQGFHNAMSFTVTGLAPITTARRYFYCCIPAGSKLLHPFTYFIALIMALFFLLKSVGMSIFTIFTIFMQVAVAFLYLRMCKDVLSRSRT